MEIQDILPITSMILMALGFIIVLIGVIWLAVQGTSNDYTSLPKSNDIEKYEFDIEKQMNINYEQVLKYRKQGKTAEQIAQELNIGKGEVNLILGIDQMR